MITCEACGTANPSEAAFCSKCARKLDAETQNSVRVQRESHTATGVRWSMVVVTSTATIVVIVLLVVIATHVM